MQEALRRAMRDKTVLAIAHRLSTIAELDRIVVLEAGRIVEQGEVGEVFARPQHPYTEALLEATLSL